MDLRSKIRLCADLFMVVLYRTDIYSWDNSIIKGVSAYFRQYFRHTLYLMSPIFFFKNLTQCIWNDFFFLLLCSNKDYTTELLSVKKKIPWWILVPWFSLSLHLVMHLQVISMKRWRVPGMALWRSWPSLWELPVPPFHHRPHSLVETHTALRWNLSISPWGGHTLVKPLSVFTAIF